MAGKTEKLVGYTLLNKIAVGGLAEIYEAVDPANGRKVALKRLKDEWREDAAVVEKIRNEAAVQLRINHSRIVRILDLVDDGNEMVIVQELVNGRSLWHDFNNETVFSAESKRNIALQLAEGIRALHEINIVHADLKALNILLENDTEALKICDFGESIWLGDSRQYRPGEQEIIWGSPLYMAPEQCRAQPVTKAADVYSAGVILYRLYGGKLPFDLADADELMQLKCISEPVSLRTICPEVPRWLDSVIQKAIRLDPADRYPDGAALYQALSIGYNSFQ